MTVLPVRSTRTAPAGAAISPLRPTAVILAFSTAKAEFSTTVLPSAMSRAPSNNTADASCEGVAWREQAVVKTRQHESITEKRIEVPLVFRRLHELINHQNSEFAFAFFQIQSEVVDRGSQDRGVGCIDS